MYKPILLLVFFPIFSFAQFSFGVRGGVNVDSKNNITAYIASIDNDINIYLNRGGSNFGGYLQYDFNRIFLRAEYNRTRIRNNHSIPYSRALLFWESAVFKNKKKEMNSKGSFFIIIDLS